LGFKKNEANKINIWTIIKGGTSIQILEDLKKNSLLIKLILTLIKHPFSYLKRFVSR